MDWASLLISGFTGGGIAAGVGLLLRVRPDVRKTNAETGKTNVDAAATIAETAMELLVPVREQLASALAQGAGLEDEMRRLRTQVLSLQHELDAYRRTYGPLKAV